MARKVTVELVDDYDNKSKAKETVTFALDGVVYEIDLSIRNAARLRGVFEKWTPHARKPGRALRGKSGGRVRASADHINSPVIREWARRNGHQVSTRGRIPTEIVAAYHGATNQ